MDHIHSPNAFQSFGFALTRLPVDISLALIYYQNIETFSDNAKIVGVGDFQAKFL